MVYKRINRTMTEVRQFATMAGGYCTGRRDPQRF
jgi:hypothetical protein